jgi:hypothetical protein
MRVISFHNGLGQIVTYPVKAEFADDDGRVFYVYGPVARGTYDTRTPYDIREKRDGEWLSDVMTA